MRPKVRFTKTLRPIISKEQLDDEANCFLTMYCPQALEVPMAVPIKEIILEKMGLELVEDKCLTSDFSLIGAMCFSGDSVTVYNEVAKSYEEIQLNKPTIIVDKNTCVNRNIGAFNNTLAHEAYHWFRHRLYAMAKNEQGHDRVIIHRCSCSASEARPKKYSEDIEFIEWQANSVAPKILMPKATTLIKIADLMEKYEYTSEQDDCAEKLKCIIAELAEFFAVSKQAAKIRMIDLGYNEASGVYNYEKEGLTPDCSSFEACKLYCLDNDFRELIDLELFRYAEGVFVINSKQFVSVRDRGQYVLTNFAKENLQACTLQFTPAVETIESKKDRDILYRERLARPPQNIFKPLYNQANIDKALECAIDLQLQLAELQLLREETAVQMLAKIMKLRMWNSSIFQQRTGINQGTYRKINSMSTKKLELPILVSICVGLNLPQRTSAQIINKAGINLTSSVEDTIYQFILSPAIPKDILACDQLIEKMREENPSEEIRLLGSQSYKDKS